MSFHVFFNPRDQLRNRHLRYILCIHPLELLRVKYPTRSLHSIQRKTLFKLLKCEEFFSRLWIPTDKCDVVDKCFFKVSSIQKLLGIDVSLAFAELFFVFPEDRR